MKIVPTLCVGMPPWTLCVRFYRRDAERHRIHSHAERGNDHQLPRHRVSCWTAGPPWQTSRCG
ncbi:hypothetical protein F7R12_05710 [Pseudomonas tolaasii]|nr:hypothetical protein F7R12_05710 [Pseudomonas tolaasii]